MKKIFSTLLLLMLVPVPWLSGQGLVYESGGELLQEQAAYNVHHYDLDLKVDPADSTVSGTVTIYADIVHPTNVVVVDLDPRLTIQSIVELSGGKPEEAEFDRDTESKRVHIRFLKTRQPGDRLEMEIHYGGRPLVAANPPWDGGFVWDRTSSGEPWIGVASQTIGSWVWWPNKDHPSDKPDSVSLNFTVPEELVVASNGRLRGTTDTGDGWKTWHWFVSTPISNYNITLNAAPYEIIRSSYESLSGDEMDLLFWVLPDRYAQGKELFTQFSEQIRFLESILGPYPFRADKYGVAHAPFLGMEHQSLIAYGANFENDNMFGAGAGFDDLHQHELAHEWWGNMVTAWDWRDFWIHEGFATYMQALYAEHLGGEGAYSEMMRIFRSHILAYQAIAPRESKTTVEVYDSGRGGDIYYKGAWFLHTLRYLIGEENFFNSLRRFAYPDPDMEIVTDGSHVRFAATDDYLDLVNDLTEGDYGWLFEVYLRQAGLPVLVHERTDDYLKLKWSTPGDIPFPVPVEVCINGELHVVSPEDGMTVPVSAEDVIEIDPRRRILRAGR